MAPSVEDLHGALAAVADAHQDAEDALAATHARVHQERDERLAEGAYAPAEAENAPPQSEPAPSTPPA